jgi:hypothetical protein
MDTDSGNGQNQPKFIPCLKNRQVPLKHFFKNTLPNTTAIKVKVKWEENNSGPNNKRFKVTLITSF